MRRNARPFTIEVKKRGGRKRDTPEPTESSGDAIVQIPAETIVGRDMRFREAESLFRGMASAAVDEPAGPGEKLPETVANSFAKAPPRRILPDLVAEAALEEATRSAMPEPRRRGRPPKERTDVSPAPARRGRKPAMPAFDVTEFFDDMPDPEPVAPVVAYLAASARRRAARDTGNLPRSERWKRRLPKVCW